MFRCLALPSALVALVLGVAVSVAVAASSASPSAPVSLLGFQSEGSPPALIARDAPALSAVGIDGLNLTGRPGTVTPVDAADRAQLAAAHRAGRPAMLLVGNFSPRIEDFSEPLAWRTLHSPAARVRAAAALAADVRRDGFDGISVDLESLGGRDRTGLTAFVAELRAALGPAASLTVCVEATGSPAGYRAEGYDLPALAATASQLVLMAYDEHGPWERTPGPVGAQHWVESTLRALLASGVEPARVDLGVAAYGYVWGSGARRQLSVAAARRLARSPGARARWVPDVGEWTAHLRDGGTEWWSDARTLALRRALAARDGLHGLALWSLGLAGRL